MPLLGGRYERRQALGVGGFGVVEQYEDKLTGTLVAIKTILAKHVNGESLRLLREIDIMCQLSNRHPRVVSVLDVFVTPGGHDPTSTTEEGFTTDEEVTPKQRLAEDDEAPSTDRSTTLQQSINENMDFNVHIVMPLMRGDLHRYTREGLPQFPNKAEFEQAVAVVFAFHLVFGLDFIHKCGIVHRDLKPENILISLDMASPYESKALIADFGLARDIRSTETFYVCTRHYRPPEVITNSAASALTGIDIWSVGCILFELVTGKFLVRLPTSLNEAGQWEPVRASMQLEAMLGIIGTPTAEDVEKYVDATKHANIKSYLLKSVPRPCRVAELAKKYWRLPGIAPEEQALWIDLIQQCVRFFPQQRPTAEQLCCHGLFQRYNVFYGHNIGQYPAKEYMPVETHSSRTQNKASILALVAQLGKDARATHSPSGTPAPEQRTPEEDASPEAVKHTTVTSTMSAVRAPSVDLPRTITDPDLRQRFGNLTLHTGDEVQSVMNTVLAELGDAAAAGNLERGEQLRHLLSFLVALIPQHSKAGEASEEYHAVLDETQ